jgi:hypothetical protein
VSGNCPVTYDVSSSWGNQKLTKTKNLMGCTERATAQTVFQSVGYNADSEIQSMPLVKGTHVCQQEINGRSKVLSKSECTETHVFRPFSKEGSGAMTEIKYKLVFQRQSEGVQQNYGTSSARVTLLYDHAVSADEMASTMREARDTVAQLCRQTEVDVRPDAPGLFATLVKQMRLLDARNLAQLFQSSKSGLCPKAETFFRDALPVLGTSASVATIRELVTRNQVSGPEAEILLTSIAFIKNPTTEMMRELQTLLSAEMQRAALPVSSVVNTYCKINKGDSPEVQAIVRTFETQLNYNCRGEEATVMLALRAIGNAGNAERVAPVLSRCAMNEEAPMSVRVAAINAYRRISCSARRDDLFRLLDNKQADAELRINAYIAIMQCADKAIVDRVRNLLAEEEANQVGSFIWTHLTNLAESSSPLKAEISKIITDPHLLTEFDVDKRKFSRNVELSYFNDLLNVGSSVESNLIFSANSYVPRSASLNLTMDVFGQSVNLLEIGGRAQGLEQVLERYFGPGGDFDKASQRDRRAVIRDDVINNIDRQFSKTRDPTQLSYFLRIFGNEIRSGDVSNFDLDSLKDKVNILDLLSKLAEDRSIDYTRNFAFLDTSFVVPTGVGMPLRLGVEGTVTVAITASGKIDLLRMLSNPSDFDVNGKIRPSAALEIQGEFGVDAHVTQTRLRMVNTLHTSTLLDGRLALKNGQIFNFDWNMPQQKMEIFSAESHFYITHRGAEREQTSSTQRPVEHKRCTDQSVSQQLGLELCGELTYPSSTANGVMFPLSGPAVAKIYLNKVDTFTGAHFEASIISNKRDNTETAHLAFTTPGSRVDREVTVDFKLDRPNKDLSLNLKSPWKKATVTGKLVDDATMKSATLRAMIDERVEYSITAELAIAEDRGREVKYTPNVRIVVPGRQPITLDGELTYTKGRKVMGSIAIRNALQEPITAEGSIELQKKRRSTKYNVNVQFSSPLLRGSVSGFTSVISDSSSVYATRADVNYQYRNGQKQRIVINHKLRDSSTANLKSYSTDGQWTTTMWPRYNGNFAFEEQYTPTSLRTRFEAGFDQTRRIVIVQSGAFDFTGVDKRFNGMLKLELPYKNWNYETKLDHIHNWDVLQTNASVKTDDNKEHSVDIGIRKDNSRYLSAVGEARLKIAGRAPMTLSNTLTEKAPREYHNVFNAVGPRRSIRSVSVYKMGQRHELTADVEATGLDPISFSGHFNPSPMNAQARAELKYGAREYMGELSWLHRGSSAGFNTRTNAEVGYLGSRYGLSSEVSLRNRDFSANMEAKYGENKKVTVSGQVSTDKTAPKIEARIEWPRNFVALTASGKCETEGWVRTQKDFLASVKVTSSFRGFEEMGGELEIDYGRDSLKSKAEVTWAANSKVTADLSYERSRALLTITTPFNGYRSIRSDLTYNKRGNTMSANGRVQWESNVISVAASGTHQGSRGYSVSNNGEITINTPWNGYRTNKLTWSHQNDEGNMLKCHHELEMDRGQKYVFDVDATNRQISGRTNGINARATFTSPIRDWERLALAWESTHDSYVVMSQGKGTISWGRQSIGIEHELNVQPSSTFIAKAKVTTPYRGYEVMGVDLNNRLDTRSNQYTLTNEVVLGDPSKIVKLDGTLFFNGPSFNTGLRLTTPYPSYPRMAINARNAKQANGAWELHGDMELVPGRPFTLDAKLGMDRTYGAELTLTSPYDNLRTMTAKALGTVRSPKSFDATVEVSHNLMDNKLKFETVVDVETLRSARLSLNLDTPFRQLSSAGVSATHSYESRDKCVTLATYKFNEYRGELRHEQTIRDAKNFEGKTRVEYLNGRVLTLDHNVAVSERRSVLSAALTTPFRELRSVDFSANVDGDLQNLRATSEITINRRDKIVANIEHAMNQDRGTIKSSLRITTPYSALQRFVYSVDHSGSTMNNRGAEWNADTEYVVEINDRRWYVKRTISLDRNGAFQANVKLQTPYESVRSSEFNLDHSPRSGRNGEGFSNTWWYELNGRRYNGESEYIWVGRQLRAKVVANVPEEYSVVVNHREDRNDISTGVTTKVGSYATGTASFQMNPSGTIDIQASVETPYRGYEKFDVTFKHEGPISNFRTTASLATPFSDYRNFAAALTYRGNPYDFVSQLTVDTPFRVMPKLTVSANHKMSQRGQLETGLSVEYASDKKVTTGVTYSNDGTTMKAGAKVTTPYRGYESFALDIEHAASSSTIFRSSAKLTTSTREVPEASLSLDFAAPSAADVRLTTELRIPSGTSRLVYNHSMRSRSDFTCNAELTTPYSGYERFSAVVSHQNGAGNPRSTVTVTTPIRGYENFALNVEKSGTAENLSLKATLTTSVRGLGSSSATWTHALTDDGIDVTADVTTPYPGYERFTVSVKHSVTANELRSSGSLVTSVRGAERYAYSVEHRASRRFVRSVVELEVAGYEKFGGNVDYSSTNSADGFRASVTINTPIREYRTFAASINHEGPASQFQTSGRISTPFRAASQIDYTVRHRGSTPQDFDSGVTVEYARGKKIEIEGAFKRTPSHYEDNYEGSFKLRSPCPYVRDLSVVASHNRKPQVKSGALAITNNGEKKIDFDYSYATEGERNIIINLRDPYPMATNLNVGDSTGSAVINWDTTNSDKKVRFDFGFKDVETSASKEKLVSFKTAIPNSRTVGFLFGYTLTPQRFTNRGELQWNAGSRPDFVYEIEGGSAERRSLMTYDGKFKVTSRIINLDTTFSQNSQPGRKHVTELGLQGSGDRVTIKSDLTFTSETDFIHSLTVQHPRFVRDASLVTEVKNGNSFKTDLSFDRQAATLEGHLIDQSRRGYSMRYSGMLGLSHRNSFTDIKLSGDIFSEEQKLGGKLEGQYQMSASRQMKIATLRAEIDRIRKELTAEMTTPIDVLRVSAVNRELVDEEGVHRYDVTATLGSANLKSTVDFSARDRSCDVKLFKNNDDYLQIFAQFLRPTQSTVEIGRLQRGQRFNDVRASLSLSDERILSGNALLRPDISRDLAQYWRELSYSPPLAREWAAATSRLEREMSEDMRMKMSSWQNAVQPISDAANAVLAEVNGKMEQLSYAFESSYRQNEFYMRDIHQALQRHYDDLSRRMHYKMIELRRCWSNICEQARRTNEMIAQKWNEAVDSLDMQTRGVRRDMSERIQRVQMYLDGVSRDIQSKMAQHTENIRRHPMVQQLARMQLGNPSQWMAALRAKYEETMARLEGMIDQAATSPQLMETRDKILRYLQENREMFEYLGLQTQLQELMYKVHTMNWPMLKAQIKQSVAQALQLNRNRWTVWNPQTGEFAFEIYMPVDLPDLSLLRKLEGSKYFRYFYNIIARYMPDEDWTMMDTIYAYKPSSEVTEWVPPFKAHASLTGSQHYMTFDKTFFEFAGECSYLLARDFIDKTFSVIVNYDRAIRGQAVKKSITVISDGKQIEVFPDARVTVDGRKMEMPIRSGNTTVSRQGSSIVVTNDLGLEVTCDLPHDHCTVAVSGWYYGKTAGLFGTYDNENFNDMMSIDGSIKEQPEDMADGWTAGARCRPVNRAVTVPVDENTRRYRACERYFDDDSSPFRSCFKRVDPEPFLTMCVNDAPMDDNSLEAQEDVCRVAAAYSHECRRHEVHMRMPSKCIECKVPFSEAKFYEGQSTTLNKDEVPKTADVIFLVQHGACNSDVIDKVKGVTDDMEKAFRAEGLRNNQYAVIGFGGEGHLSLPKVRTMDGQIFNSANKVSSAFDGFELVSSSSPDVMLAIKYAAKQPFRAGASKSIIVIPCDSCREQSIRYSDIQRLLVHSDIRLHMLIQEQINLKSRSPKTAFIFGVDDETVYTNKDVSGNEMAGEADLRRYVRLPKDLCVALTHETDGSVFSVRQWIDTRSSIQKKFSDVFVRAVALKALPSDCQVCECVADSAGSGISQCHKCGQRGSILSLLPNFYRGDFDDDDEVPQIASPSRGLPTDGGYVTEAPTRPTRRPRNRGDRVRRPKGRGRNRNNGRIRRPIVLDQ